MAIAVIGGLIFSTLLSLIFVPAVFMAVSRLSDLRVPRRGRVPAPDGHGAARPEGHAA